MRIFSRRADLTCRAAIALITDYLDGALPADRRRRLERHLAGCPHCAQYIAQIRAIIASARHVDADQLSPDARQTLITLYRQTQTR